MNEEQVREIAATAFKARFRDIDIICINVKHGFDHYDDPALDVTIIYDGEVGQLNGEGILRAFNRSSSRRCGRKWRTPRLAVHAHDRQVRHRRRRRPCHRVRMNEGAATVTPC